MRFFRRWRTRILLFFAVVGPGFITANVDNDANGIVTYSQAGAQFGYQLLWTMIPVTLALIVVQEICARMGAVTGGCARHVPAEEGMDADCEPHTEQKRRRDRENQLSQLD